MDDRLAADHVAGVVVDVVELRPVADAIAAQVRVAAQAQRRRGLPRLLQLDAAAIAAVDVAAQQQADVGELAGRGDLVAELHRVHVRLERRGARAAIPSRLEVEQPLGLDRAQVVRERGVVLALEEIVARRLARGETGRGVDAAVR